jgi:hypothetical protein
MSPKVLAYLQPVATNLKTAKMFTLDPGQQEENIKNPQTVLLKPIEIHPN